jgi:hypothetical protein
VVGANEPVDEFGADQVAQVAHGTNRRLLASVGPQSQPETEFGVVLEERVGPGRSSSRRVDGPRGGGQVATVDRGTPGGVGHDEAISEQLREQLEIRRLAASGAGAAELEQRLQRLGPLDGRHRHLTAVDGREIEEEGEPFPLPGEDRVLGHHVERLVLHQFLAARRTHLGTDGAAGAVIGSHLDHQPLVGEVLAHRRPMEEARRGPRQCRLVDVGDADRGVRAHQGAAPAVDTDVGIPDWDLVGDRPLLPPRGVRGEGTVDRHRAHRE